MINTIAIIADAQKSTGVGHLIRSLELAQKLKLNQKNILIIFLIDNKIMETIIDDKFPTYFLHSNNELDKSNSYNFNNEELIYSRELTIKKFLEMNTIDMLIIDSFNVNKKIFKSLHKLVKKIVYFDSFAKESFNVDVIINANYNAEYLAYKTIYPKAKLLLGVDYFLLRDEFLNQAKKKIQIKATSVMINTGGSDQYGVTLKVLKMLLKTKKFQNYQINIIINDTYKNTAKILNLKKLHKNIHLYSSLNSKNKLITYKKISDVMRESDMAITAAGTTLYELISMRIPSIAFTVSNNQERLARDLYHDNYIEFLGSFQNISRDLIKKLYNLDRYTKRLKYFKNSKNLIDGLGALRTTNNILSID